MSNASDPDLDGHDLSVENETVRTMWAEAIRLRGPQMRGKRRPAPAPAPPEDTH